MSTTCASRGRSVPTPQSRPIRPERDLLTNCNLGKGLGPAAAEVRQLPNEAGSSQEACPKIADKRRLFLLCSASLWRGRPVGCLVLVLLQQRQRQIDLSF